MTSVWIRTEDESYDVEHRYVNAEKIETCSDYADNSSITINDDDRERLIGITTSEVGYTIYRYDKESGSDSRIKHIIQWINKAKILASEKDEPVFLDFNKDFENPIVED
ncbi:hypothetical protein [Methanococcoides sp. LMO-2]|uniref:Uncharacterized protein n=1 Tax=Methanococcoides cohabitans TaxID=3136559 RepID=A0ABU9KVK7_9EURY